MKVTGHILMLLPLLTAYACTEESSPAPGCIMPDTIAFDARESSYDGPDTTGTITTENISDFRICGYLADWSRRIIMDNVTVTRTGRNSWTYPELIKWPETPVNFEAVSPADYDIKLNQWDYPSIVNFRSSRNVDGSDTPVADVDLCVAVRRDATKGDGRLRLNFRHCMARVHLDIAADIPQVSVIVKEITMSGMCDGGDFYIPKESTSADSIGQFDNAWADWTQYNTNMTIPYFVAGEGQEVPLATKPQPLANQNNYFYVPFPFRPMRLDDGRILGSAIRVLCKLTVTANGATLWPNKNTPYQLRPGNDSNSEYAYIYFGLMDEKNDHTRWRPGFDYHYTITIRSQGTLPGGESSATRGFHGIGNTVTASISPY